MTRPMLQIFFFIFSPLTLPFLFSLVIAQGSSKKLFCRYIPEVFTFQKNDKRAVRVESNKETGHERIFLSVQFLL